MWAMVRVSVFWMFGLACPKRRPSPGERSWSKATASLADLGFLKSSFEQGQPRPTCAAYVAGPSASMIYSLALAGASRL